MKKIIKRLFGITEKFTDTDFDKFCESRFYELSNKDQSLLERANDYESIDRLITQGHHEYGRWLRNKYGLWREDTPIVKWFKEKYDISHADDMSSIICAGIILHDRPEMRDDFIAKQVERYKKHWIEWAEDHKT